MGVKNGASMQKGIQGIDHPDMGMNITNIILEIY